MARGSDFIPLPSRRQLVLWKEQEAGARQSGIQIQLGECPHLLELSFHQPLVLEIMVGALQAPGTAAFSLGPENLLCDLQPVAFSLWASVFSAGFPHLLRHIKPKPEGFHQFGDSINKSQVKGLITFLSRQVKTALLPPAFLSCPGKGVVRPLGATPPNSGASSPRPTLRPRVGTQQ